MRLCYIVFGILIILSIIDFAVAAPVPVREKLKPQARVDVVHIPGDAMTVLGKRAGDLDELFAELFGAGDSAGLENFAKPVESSATRPSSSSQPSGPAGGSTDVEKLLPPIHEEPVPVSSQVHAPPSLGDERNKMLIQGHFPENLEESSAARPSSSSQPSGLADGSTDVEKPLPSIPDPDELWPNLFGQPGSYLVAKPEELSAARQAWLWKSSGPADRGTGVKRPRPFLDPDKLWPNLFGQPGRFLAAKPEALSAAARLSWNSPKEPAEGWTDVKKLIPSITEEPEPVFSPYHTPPNPGSLAESGNELTKGDAPSGPSGPASSTMSSADQELMGTHSLPNTAPLTESGHEMMGAPPSGPESSTMSSADQELMGAHSLPNPGPLTESGPEMMGVPPSSSVSPTNPDGQWTGAGSSSGKRKRP
jgi:hypothetical protein